MNSVDIFIIYYHSRVIIIWYGFENVDDPKKLLYIAEWYSDNYYTKTIKYVKVK